MSSGVQKLQVRAVGLLLAVVCLGAYGGSNPLLHAVVHGDAESSSHECLATLFSKQVIVPASSPIVLVVVVRPLLFAPLPASEQADEEVICRIGFPRAPPPFFSSHRVVG